MRMRYLETYSEAEHSEAEYSERGYGEAAEPAALRGSFLRWRRANRWADRAWLILLIGLLTVVISVLAGQLQMLAKGMGGGETRDLNELLAINPDTVCWLMIDGTNVDHPVVQGKDNFEYLDKAFTGEFYAGGTLFLDARNSKDFSDPDKIIHGHHMAAGAMFGGLDRFLEKEYLDRHRTGKLITPEREYSLRAISAGVYDAYDGRIFGPGIVPEAFKERAPVLALSTCTEEMNDDRTVVFFEMKERRRQE